LVENAVRIVYTWIFARLRNQQFFSLQELNQSISILLEEHNDCPISREKVSRRTLFEEIEKPA